MGGRKTFRLGGLILAAAVVGYLIGPPIAQAAASLVTVKDPKTSQKARVTRGNLWVDASLSSVYSKPWGETVLDSQNSTSGVTFHTTATAGDITGISLDVPVGGASAVTVTVRKGATVGIGTVIWQGTLPAAGHLDYAFDQDIYLPGGVNVSITDSGGAGFQYEIYGAGFGTPFAPRANSKRAGG